MAFMALLSIFPFMIFLAALAGFFGNAGMAGTFIDLMLDFLPPDVSHVLAPAVREVLTNRQGGLLTFGLVTAIWAASSGIEALRTALNQAYQIAEPRPIWYLRLQSIAMVFLSAFAVLGLSVTVFFGPILLNLVERLVWVPEGYRVLWQIGRYAIGAALTTALVMVLHGWLPRARQRWRDILPGALATTALWLVAANLFSVYLGTVGSYSVTYGSLAGIVITLIFLYITSLIFIFGAELNALLRRRHAGAVRPISLDAVRPRR